MPEEIGYPQEEGLGSPIDIAQAGNQEEYVAPANLSLLKLNIGRESEILDQIKQNAIGEYKNKQNEAQMISEGLMMAEDKGYLLGKQETQQYIPPEDNYDFENTYDNGMTQEEPEMADESSIDGLGQI